jgi:hypothetical protein
MTPRLSTLVFLFALAGARNAHGAEDDHAAVPVPAVKIGFGFAEQLFINGGGGFYHATDRDSGAHFELLGQLGFGGTGVGLEGGLCWDAPHAAPCVMGLTIGTRYFRTFERSSLATGDYWGVELGARFLILVGRVGVLRSLEGHGANVFGSFALGFL